ncbi:MAG TPA: GntG family PLP-dependent aldolase, partial [Candidatus Kapabacteria bacterium]|nr:GntG family PLP-dependent aldolase [Candidatus Kapabacteria bacterium]
MIDLRSDTVTKPTPEMRRIMAEAEVGDDVFGEDPTVNRLQTEVAAMFGKEAALFVSTGVMGNQLAIHGHTLPGDEIIVEKDSHIFNYEAAAPSILSGVQLSCIAGTRGIVDLAAIENAIRDKDDHNPRTSLVAIENTHNRAGGTIYPIERIKEISALCKKHGLKFHMDGARLWNAHVASGVSLKEYGKHVDSFTVCFSKGLGAPVGSMLCGDKALIENAHKFRKIMGGGMRQVGILAAAAEYAIKNNITRMSEDHAKAKYFSDEVSKLSSFVIDKESVQTNIVIADCSPAKSP